MCMRMYKTFTYILYEDDDDDDDVTGRRLRPMFLERAILCVCEDGANTSKTMSCCQLST